MTEDDGTLTAGLLLLSNAKGQSYSVARLHPPRSGSDPEALALWRLRDRFDFQAPSARASAMATKDFSGFAGVSDCFATIPVARYRPALARRSTCGVADAGGDRIEGPRS